MQNLTIQCFGAFRAVADSITISTPKSATVQTIKQAIVDNIGTQYQALVTDSVLATDTVILQDWDVVDPCVHLSILPPVCGG